MKNPQSARFQSFECESVVLPPGTPAATRPPDRPRELPWVNVVLEKIDAPSHLKRGWDSHDGLPLSAAAQRMALDVLAGIRHHDLPVPAVVLGSGGTIHFEWQMQGKELEIGCGENGTLEYVKLDAKGNVEEGQKNAGEQEQLDSLVAWLKDE